jgi:hypothetical protein
MVQALKPYEKLEAEEKTNNNHIPPVQDSFFSMM